jgi:hypothetical protein
MGSLFHLQHVAEAERRVFGHRLRKNLNRAVLNSGGRVSHADAEASATTEYHKFDDERRRLRSDAQLRELAELKATGKGLPKSKRV